MWLNANLALDSDAPKSARQRRVNAEVDNMPIFFIFRANHYSNMLCIDRTGEVLQDIGAERQPKMSEKEFKEAVHQIDRTLLFVLLIFVGLVCLSIVFVHVSFKISELPSHPSQSLK
jgi:hypothetical protein